MAERDQEDEGVGGEGGREGSMMRARERVGEREGDTVRTQSGEGRERRAHKSRGGIIAEDERRPEAPLSFFFPSVNAERQ